MDGSFSRCTRSKSRLLIVFGTPRSPTKQESNRRKSVAKQRQTPMNTRNESSTNNRHEGTKITS